MTIFQMVSFFQVKFPAFGLDISDRSVKVAEVKRTKREARLSAFGESRLSEGAVAHGKIQDPKKVAAGIIQTLASVKGKKIDTRYVICALPEEQSFVRVIQLPRMPREEIAKAVQWEVEANIPAPIEQVYFDWNIIQQITNPKGSHFDLLIAAVGKDIVDSYVEAIEAAGLTPLALEVESSAMARAILKFGISYPPTLIVDFGETRAGLAIVSGQSVRFTSTLSIAGGTFTEAIAKSLNIDAAKAEERKRQFGFDPGTKEGAENRAVVLPVLENFMVELKEYIEFYKTHAPHEHSVYTLTVLKIQEGGSFNLKPVAGQETLVAREAGSLGITGVRLCGGEANLPGVTEFFAEALAVPVERADVFTNLVVKKGYEPDIGPRDRLRFVTAIGLALRSLS